MEKSKNHRNQHMIMAPDHLIIVLKRLGIRTLEEFVSKTALFLKHEYIDALHESLQAQIDTLPVTVDNLKKLGIRDLEDLVRKVAPYLTIDQLHKLYEWLLEQMNTNPVTIETFERALIEEQAGPAVHKELKVPFRVGTTIYEPQDTKQFNGTTLHLYCDDTTSKNGVVLAYTSKAKLRKALKERGVLPPDFEESLANGSILKQDWWMDDRNLSAKLLTISRTDYYFHEHINYRGGVLLIKGGNHISDLRSRTLDRSCTSQVSWNDVISSIDCAVINGVNYNYGLFCFEHINFGGELLYIRGRVEIPNLVVLGWNDRISSIITQQNY